MFADYNYVDPVSPACAQIVIIILSMMGVEVSLAPGRKLNVLGNSGITRSTSFPIFLSA